VSGDAWGAGRSPPTLHLVAWHPGRVVLSPTALVQCPIEPIGHLEDAGPTSKIRIVQAVALYEHDPEHVPPLAVRDRNESGSGANADQEHVRRRSASPNGELQENRQLALGGLRFFATSASVIIIIGSTGHS
jgi:hypothetical protein